MTTVLETTARATDARHLELDEPLAVPPGGKVRVIVQVEEGLKPAAQDVPTAEDYGEIIRRANERFPCPEPRTTAEWMKLLREGEQD
jgi:hypothetical protein